MVMACAQAAFQKRLGLRKAQLQAVSQSSEGTDSLDDELRNSILDYDAGPGVSYWIVLPDRSLMLILDANLDALGEAQA
jgi:hypothetical protein